MFRYFLLLTFIIASIVPAYADSIDDLERALTRNPGDLAARKQLAVSYYEKGDLNRAIIQLESLVQLAPEDVDVARSLMASYRMVSLKLQAQKEYPEALRYADKCIALARRYELDPVPGQYQRVIVLSEKGEMAQALQELSELPPDSQLTTDAQDLIVAALLRQAKASIKKKDYQKALEQIDKAYQVDPQKYSYLHLQTVHILAYIGETEKALEVLDPLAHVLPQDNDLFQYRIGSLYKELGETSAAADFLARVPEGSPYYEGSQELLETASRVMEMLQELREALSAGDLDLAVIKLRDLVRLDPTQHRMRLNLAKLLIRQEERQGALAELEILSMSPRVIGDPFYQFEMGKLYKSLGQRERSERLLKQIPEDSPHYSEAQKLLGEMTQPVKPDEEPIEKPEEKPVEKPDVELVKTAGEEPDEKPDVEPVQPPVVIKSEADQKPPTEEVEISVEPEQQEEDKPPLDPEPPESIADTTGPESGETAVQDQVLPTVEPDVEPIQEPIIEPEEPPAPSLATAQMLVEQGQGDEAVLELDRLVADPTFQGDDRMEYEVGILYMQLGHEDNAKKHLQNVSEDSMFHQAAQAFLVEPVVEEPAVEEQVPVPEEEPQPTRPLHPVEKRVRDITGKHRIETSLALALMMQESSFRKHAVSGAGAAGLCQIMPATGRDLGLKIPNYRDRKKPKIDPKVDERFDPYKCMDAGFKYLRQLLNRYDGNVPLALSAYNAGMGRTKSRVARIYETTSYVSDIMTYYWRYQDGPALDQAMAKLVDNIQAEG